MSIRRRAIRARVEREQSLKRGHAEVTESCNRMKAVLDELQAEGVTRLDPHEFWRRYHAKAPA